MSSDQNLEQQQHEAEMLKTARAWVQTHLGHAESWINEEVSEHFEFHGFLGGQADVIRKSDGARGWLAQTDGPKEAGPDWPRLYYNFRPRLQ